MCGIGFVINYGEDQIDLDTVEVMFKNMEQRGDHASGIYYERPDKNGNVISRVFKAPVCSSDLWNSVQLNDKTYDVGDGFHNLCKLTGEERLIILHTRQATKGSVTNNHNNMPIYSKNWLLVHNGIVGGTRLNNFEYKGEVDSEELLARLETTNSVVKAIEETTGSMAVVIRPFKKKHIYIFRNTNPLWLVTANKPKILYGCSCSDYILDKDMLEYQGKKGPFGGGYSVHQLRPHITYQVDIHEPNIEPVSTYEKLFQDEPKIQKDLVVAKSLVGV